MEGGGTRLGRASSRYGSTQQQQVFDGPVRKWKKQWVSNGSEKRSNTPPLLLCRWTPLSAAAAADDEYQPPKRRFRYTPIVPIEKEKWESHEKEGKENNQSGVTMGNDNIFENTSVTPTQEASEGQSDSNRSLDDDMDFNSNRKNPNLDGEEETKT